MSAIIINSFDDIDCNIEYKVSGLYYQFNVKYATNFVVINSEAVSANDNWILIF